ncbi:MAG: hypothetical protein ACOH1J_05590 [Microbacteriaceae bacterium]
MTWQIASIVPIWVLSVVGGITIGALAPQEKYLDALPILLAVCIVATFCIQLAIQRKEGFVNRVMASIAGAVVILAVVTAVLFAR